MKANFVQKRKDEHSPGPYEPPAQKIPRKSVIIQKIPNDLDYLRQSLERPWREVHELPCNWDGIRDQDDISQYMHAIKVKRPPKRFCPPCIVFHCSPGLKNSRNGI